MIADVAGFAEDWIDSWNSHDLERILSHYSDGIQITSPMIKVALEIESGTLVGKEAVRQYWAAALQKVPDLSFELVNVTQSVDSIALYYKSVMEKMAIEVMFFDADGRVSKVIAHYT